MAHVLTNKDVREGLNILSKLSNPCSDTCANSVEQRNRLKEWVGRHLHPTSKKNPHDVAYDILMKSPVPSVSDLSTTMLPSVSAASHWNFLKNISVMSPLGAFFNFFFLEGPIANQFLAYQLSLALISNKYRLQTFSAFRKHFESLLELPNKKTCDAQTKHLAILVSKLDTSLSSSKFVEACTSLRRFLVQKELATSEKAKSAFLPLFENSNAATTWRAEKFLANAALAVGIPGLFIAPPMGALLVATGTMLHWFRQMSFNKLQTDFERALN